jgi:transcriptional regulator with XRE-family HTH domain
MAGNTVSRLLLGQHLRQLREQKGIHSEDAAGEVGVARATLWRMEKGDNRCRYKPGDVEMLGRLYGADKGTVTNLVDLAKATRARSWIAAYRDILPAALETYIDLESFATRMRVYSTALVPDLLQDEDYAKVLIRASRHLSNIDVRKHTQIRMNRQRVLTEDPTRTTFEFIIDEAVLSRGIGEPAITVQQLRQLVAASQLPNVTFRVVPYRAGMYAGLETGSFTLLEFPTDPQFGSLPTTVHVNRLGEHQLLDKARDVEQYEERWNDIRAHTLDDRTSRHLVLETIQQFEQ